MTTVRLIGDVHGRWLRYRKLTKDISTSIQVGDFGIGFHEFDDTMMAEWSDNNPTHHFIRGNHDNLDRIKTLAGFFPDGTVINGNVMLIGGAWSIDHAQRTPGIDWWDNEELSYQDLKTLIDTYEALKPEIMITHDCPTTVAYHMFVRPGQTIMRNGFQVLTRTGEAFQTMFELHQPKHWYFGHWHVTKTTVMEGTQFQCLGELDHMDVEL